MARRYATVALCALALIMAGACKPQAGAKCSGGQVACADAKTGLFCSADGTFHTMTCSGPAGCTGEGASLACDNSVAAVNDGCNTPDDAACSTDHKAALLCKNGVFAIAETCKGPGACKVNGDTITCDNDVSDVGDPCRTAGDYACTSDRGTVLRCDAGKMTALNTCRGPKACSIVNHPAENKVEFVCDDSLAKEGDPCDTDGEEACTMDKKAILVCQKNAFGNPKPCAGGCSYDESFDRYSCDQGGGAGAGGDAGTDAAAAPPGKKKR